MNRRYIEDQQIVERYLSGDLTVREARDFEKYCLDHPEFLNSMPIPVRLKARLARRPLDDSETGVFPAIPSSTTRAALEVSQEDYESEVEEPQPRSSGVALNYAALAAIVLALLGAAGAALVYAGRANDLATQLQTLERQTAAVQMQAPGSVERYRVQPVRGKPQQPTLALGWLTPPQLLDIYVDVSAGKYTQFLLTIDRADGVRIMQLRRIARDSNRELRLGLNSSAFGPGEFLVQIEGYNWRGQTEPVGWLRLALE